ncbi:MAG: hypothetical protein ACREQY_11670 [Candidatus Binatia bacterium]
MRFIVLSRLQALSLDLRERHAVISIREPGSDMPQIPSNDFCRGILRLSFHDRDRLDTPETELFTAEHARRILGFVDGIHGTIDALVVHCEAGISRSAAVAAALSRALFGEDRFFFDHYAPNRLVYATLLRACEERRAQPSQR